MVTVTWGPFFHEIMCLYNTLYGHSLLFFKGGGPNLLGRNKIFGGD